MNIFKEIQDHKPNIKLHLNNHKAQHAITQKIIEPNGPVEPHFWECESLLVICLTYIIGSIKTHSNDAIYHMVAKILKFFNMKMECAHDNQEVFCWVVMWAYRYREKKRTNILGYVELKAMKAMEQPSIDQNENKLPTL